MSALGCEPTGTSALGCEPTGTSALGCEPARTSAARVLVAGVGNIFLGDDGVGVEVASRLAGVDLPDGVRVADFGIRGVHLAYELLGGAYDALVLVDAVDRGDEPGTVSLIEHRDAAAPAGGDGVLAAMDAHGMDPASVLAMLGDLGGSVGRVLVVGVQVAGIGEGMALSAAVAAAVPAAVEAVVEVVGSLVGETGLVAPPPAPRRAKEVR